MRALLLTFVMLAGSTAAVQSQTHLTLLPESRVTLRGSSTLHRFTCSADGVQGSGFYARGQAVATLHVRVADLDCGKARMNDDLRATLRADDYPVIAFSLDNATVDEGVVRPLMLRVVGRLTLAGTTRPVTLSVEATRRTDGTYAATATVPLRMSTFSLSPPTALLGLVRVHDRIEVAFDLIAAERAPAARR